MQESQSSPLEDQLNTKNMAVAVASGADDDEDVNVGSSDSMMESALASIVDIGRRKLLQFKRQYFDDSGGGGDPDHPVVDQIVSNCHLNCSGNGECHDGSCYCMVRLFF